MVHCQLELETEACDVDFYEFHMLQDRSNHADQESKMLKQQAVTRSSILMLYAD